MVSRVTFAHLSDIHFVRGLSDTSAFDLDRILREAILADARVIRGIVGDVYGILVSGDIAFAGKSAEYQIALGWLDRLTEQLGCRSEMVWCVPGNHDVDRSVLKELSAISALHEQLKRSGRVDEQLREHLENTYSGPLLFAPLKTYNEEFAAKFNCVTVPRRPWWEYDIELNDGSTLRLRGMNSVLTSGPDDDDKSNRLILGSAQVELGHEEGVEYLTLCHHPVDWLRDADSIEQALLAYSKIHLSGHKHRHRIVQMNDSVWLSAGAVHPSRSEQAWIPQYNYISLTVEGGGPDRTLVVDVYTRTWSQADRMFTQDQNAHGANCRTYRLKLREWRPPLSVPASERGDVSSSSWGQRMSPDETLSQKRLLYEFVSLPHHSRMEIMQSFGLLESGDEKRPDAEVFTACFERARQKGVLDEVWNAIRAARTSQR
ncbi:MAG: metallophosphoesterase [Bryobacteraceae bacterium]|nr:metallophosphoesterase [Bryobacteraceae bacterium]